MWNSFARSLLVTCLIHERWLCEKPWMKRISGPFGLPQSCAEIVRPSGVFTETALNFCSCAGLGVEMAVRDAATKSPARQGQRDVEVILQVLLIADPQWLGLCAARAYGANKFAL